jgi:nucleotide-binding universal stress UspA family protein
MKKSIVPIDFSKESIPAFKKAFKTLDFLNATKHILYVNQPNKDFKTTL